MFEPVKQSRLSDVIAAQLRKLILEGTLRPGTRLQTERELADRFSTSRPTIREAINKLEEEGLLQMQRGGMHIADPAAESLTEPLSALLMSDPQGVSDYMAFRQIIEGAAAYLAAKLATALDHQNLHDALTAMQEAHEKGNREAEAEADTRFHLAIYEASHNRAILHVMSALSSIMKSYVLQNRRVLYDRQGYREATMQQHQAIYRAIVKGSAEEAKELAQAHLSYARDAIEEKRKADERLEVSLRRLNNAHEPVKNLV